MKSKILMVVAIVAVMTLLANAGTLSGKVSGVSGESMWIRSPAKPSRLRPSIP